MIVSRGLLRISCEYELRNSVQSNRWEAQSAAATMFPFSPFCRRHFHDHTLRGAGFHAESEFESRRILSARAGARCGPQCRLRSLYRPPDLRWPRAGTTIRLSAGLFRESAEFNRRMAEFPVMSTLTVPRSRTTRLASVTKLASLPEFTPRIFFSNTIAGLFTLTSIEDR